MARFLILGFVLVQVMVVLAMGHDQLGGSDLNAPMVGASTTGRLTHNGIRSSSGLPEPPVSGAEASEGESTEEAEAPEIRRMGPNDRHHHHHSSDKSIFGGGVIIGGLATAIFAAVFCYIRVTRKHHADGPAGSKV